MNSMTVARWWFWDDTECLEEDAGGHPRICPTPFGARCGRGEIKIETIGFDHQKSLKELRRTIRSLIAKTLSAQYLQSVGDEEASKRVWE